MARIQSISDAGDNEALQKAYAYAERSGWKNDAGVLDNFTISYGTRPDLLEATLDIFHAVLAKGELPMTLKAMLFYAIASEAKCGYCAAYTQHALQKMGVPEEAINSCANDPELADLPPAQREIVRFALKAAKAPKELTDDDFAKLRDQGLGDGEIAELVMMTGMATMLDIWADAMDIAVDY